MAKHLIVVLLWLVMNGGAYNVRRSAQSEIPADTVITLERTICYGSCPMYKLTVKADGSVEFEPKYVRDRSIVSGEIKRGVITREQLRRLISEFEEARYFSLKDRYAAEQDGCRSFLSDSPSAITSIRINGREKSIYHNYGCRDQPLLSGPGKVFPRELTELENKIDEVVNTKQWLR